MTAPLSICIQYFGLQSTGFLVFKPGKVLGSLQNGLFQVLSLKRNQVSYNFGADLFGVNHYATVEKFFLNLTKVLLKLISILFSLKKT